MSIEEKLQQMTILVLGNNDNKNNLESKHTKKTSPLTGAFIFRDTDIAWANRLQHDAVENSRLGIPVLLGYDVIHGYRTLFPIPLAQSCAWDADLVYRLSRVAAKESYLTGVRWTFSPMIDVARDPRWGRVAESYGEDPYANSVYCVSAVRGYQGQKLSDRYSIASCLKHFGGYAYSQGGRDYHPTDISDLSLWETVFPPYKAGVEAGAVTVMSAFNDLNGVPATANRFLLQETLRERWGFEGFVVADWCAVEQLINQRFAADTLDAGVKALTAGVDMDMYDDIYNRYMGRALAEGLISQADLDQAVRRILRVKFELGLFENPYTEEQVPEKIYFEKESVALAHRAAEESMVLLKNEKGILPLSASVKKILLVGPMATDRRNMMGTWIARATPDRVETIYEGLRQEFGGQAEIMLVEGAGIRENTPTFVEEALRAAQTADVVVVAMGEEYGWSGENGSVASIDLPASQVEVVRALSQVGKPLVVAFASGRPIGLSEIEPRADAIVCMWQPGYYGGSALAGILSGRVNPSGKLSITFPLVTGQIPVFYNYRQNARVSWKNNGKYADCSERPLYEFGHGLSYSTFVYSELKASRREFSAGDRIELSVKVRNTSERGGKEAVLWYVDDPVASVSQPVRKLKHFEKRWIPAGGEAVFVFEIDPQRDLSFVDRTGQSHLEPGEFIIRVADQSISLRMVE